jgi:hypothetical protein
MASLAHSALSPPDEERSQDSSRKFSIALYFLKSSESTFLLLERLHPVNADFFLTGVAADFSWIGDALTSRLKHPLEYFVFIFEEAITTEDIAFGEGEGSRLYALWCDVWKAVASRPRLRQNIPWIMDPFWTWELITIA